MYRLKSNLQKTVLLSFVIALMSLGCPVSVTAYDGSLDSHKNVVRRMVDEGLNQGVMATFDELLAPDYVNQGISGSMGIKAFKDYIAALRVAMPDFHVTTEVMVAEEDTVASRFAYSGTFKNPLAWPDAKIPPTGKPIKWTANVFHAFNKDGKIAEVFTAFDQLDFMMQLGASPALTLLSVLRRPAAKPIQIEAAKTKDLEKQHKETFQRFIDKALNQGELDVMFEILAPGYIGHDPFADLDRTGFRNVIAEFRRIVPDLNVTPDILIAEGDWAAARLIYRGTFTNNIALPFITVRATNKPIQFIINVIVHLDEDGQAAEDWKEFNRLAWLQQVEILPAS
jgi:predicted ester cyclase